jgi:DNA-binding NarL/FixJ family response regulator
LERTRILLAGLPTLLEEIVIDILAGTEADDLELVGVAHGSSVARKVERLRPDVVIVGGDNRAMVATLLERHPRLKVLAVATDARDSWLYALRPERVQLGCLSAESLVAAVRPPTEREAHVWWRR